MSERDEYPAGVPCWVDTLQEDPRAAQSFYGALLGWTFEGSGSATQEYFVARLRGRDVAGVGTAPSARGTIPWTTYVAVEDVEEAVARATSAGGSVLDGPIDASPAGRLAVLADPAGAAFGVWHAETRQGAQIVNEPSAWSLSLLHSTDVPAATEFYETLFGWEIEPFKMGSAELTICRAPGYFGGEPSQPVPRDTVAVILPLDGEDGRGSFWSVDFWIDDVDIAAGRMSELGGSIVEPPSDVPAFRTAVLADPGGASFSVSALVGPPAD